LSLFFGVILLHRRLAIGADPTRVTEGYVDAICTVVMMACVVVILAAAMRRWSQVLSGKVATMDLSEA